jgi:hypothetical protein
MGKNVYTYTLENGIPRGGKGWGGVGNGIKWI